MPSPAGPAEHLADLAGALDAIGVRWYVFGAQATLIWGRPRLTTDVAVTVQCALPTRELVSALEARGIRATLKLLEDALGQSDLTPALDRELDRWRRSE